MGRVISCLFRCFSRSSSTIWRHVYCLRDKIVKTKKIANVRKLSSSVMVLYFLLATNDVLAQSQTCFEEVKIEANFIAFTAKKDSWVIGTKQHLT